MAVERVCNAAAGSSILILTTIKIGSPTRHALVCKLLADNGKGEA